MPDPTDQGPRAPEGETTSAPAEAGQHADAPAEGAGTEGHEAEPRADAPVDQTAPPADDYQNDYDSTYHSAQADATAVDAPPPSTALTAPPAAPPPPPPPAEEEDKDEDGMLRMSFLEHLEELRHRIVSSLAGIGVAFVVAIVFANQLWLFVSEPAVAALTRIGVEPTLIQISPMDAFMIIWVKLPLLAAIFLASPWVLFQVWSFVAPGLYKRERSWAAPFVISTAGLFIAGGLFAYFVAFRFGLEFLLSIGVNINVRPAVSMVEYFDLFVNVMLGVGLVFEMPVLIFFLTLIRVASPAYLMRNARYAILIIVVIAAFITPTPDVFNLVLFCAPMILLFFVGVFASYLLVRHREKKIVWPFLLAVFVAILLLTAGGIYLAITKYGFHLVPHWPFLTR